jgi:iduronate 2-sulfatase
VNFSDWGNFTDIPNTMTLDAPMDSASAARLRRGYSASISYTDANIGKVLAELEPMKATTVVMMIGDHGWSLGEQVS